MAWRAVAAAGVACMLVSTVACDGARRAPPPARPSLLLEVGEGMQHGASTLTPTLVPNPTNPTVRFMGRFDMSDPQGPRFAWSASGIATRFRGTGIDVRL